MRKWMILSAFLASLGAGLGAGAPAFAADYTDTVIAELQSQGYGRIETEVTWLGRVRIVARRDEGSREIILNPRTGEILRDLWLLSTGEAGRSLLIGGGTDDGIDDGDIDDDWDGDDDDGDDDGDDDDDDNSGSGSGSDDDDDDRDSGDDDGGDDD